MQVRCGAVMDRFYGATQYDFKPHRTAPKTENQKPTSAPHRAILKNIKSTLRRRILQEGKPHLRSVLHRVKPSPVFFQACRQEVLR